jgi:hypothetical protein
MTVCGNSLLRSLLMTKRTCRFALHMSANDPKRTCRTLPKHLLEPLPFRLKIRRRYPCGLHGSRRVRKIWVMRRAFQRMVVLLVAVGLAVSGPFASHARISSTDHATSHEIQAVSHYADLAIDSAEDECPHATSGTTNQSHDDGLCNKCCAACTVASLIPTVPTAAWALLVARGMFLTRHDILVARAVPIEPGIPKPL